MSGVVLPPGSFAEYLFNRLTAGGSAGLAALGIGDLDLLCLAVGAMFQDREDIIRVQSDGTPGYAILMSADTAPSSALGWLAQFVGVTLDPALGDTAQRARIKATDGQSRGKPSAIIGAARTYLSDPNNDVVILREKWNPVTNAKDDYHYEVITYTSQTPDAALVEAALVAQKPGGLIMHYSTAPGQDYLSLKNNNATYADIKATYATYAGIPASQPGT